MARLPQSLGNSAFLMFMGQCKDSDQLEETVACSQDCIALKQLLWSEDHSDAPAASEPLLIQEEIHRIGQLAGNVSELSKELKREISTLKETRQKVRNRKNENVDVTKEIFASLRKALDEREEQIIADIEIEGEKRENILEFQLKKLMLLYSQLKNTLDLTKKTKEEEKVNAPDLISRRKILEQRRDHLVVMKRKSQLESVRKEQRKMKFDGVEQLQLGINQLGFIPLDPNKCEAAIPSLIVNKETVVIITVRDINNDLVSDSSEELDVSVQIVKNGEAVAVKAITELDNGRYNALFIPNRCGDHVVSVKVDGHHIPDSPFRLPADRDYSRITVQDCSQVLTHYGGKKFAGLTDVAVGPNDEILIADYGNRSVIVLDRQLNLLRVIGQDSRLVAPFGIAISDNIIAVSDHGSHQLKKYSLQGDLLSIIGCYGKNDGQFHTPKGLAFGYNNKLLYVVDWGNHRVQAFQQDDEFAFLFGIKPSGPGKFHNPAKIATDLSNNVLVSDFDDHFIYLFTHDGQLIKRIYCFLPYAITVSPTGYVITDHNRDNNMITIYSPTHQLINKFGQRGSQQGDFDDIRGMAVGSTGDIYVVEGGNNRLQVINSK